MAETLKHIIDEYLDLNGPNCIVTSLIRSLNDDHKSKDDRIRDAISRLIEMKRAIAAEVGVETQMPARQESRSCAPSPG